MWPSSKSLFSTTTTTILLLLLLFCGMCIFRLFNTILIQSFFDPDEYWQTLEPAYCEVFYFKKKNNNFHNNQQHQGDSSSSLNLECPGYTWEWKRRRRSHQSAPINDESITKTTATKIIFDFFNNSFEGPIRSYLSVVPIHIYYWLLKQNQLDTHYLISEGPKLVTAVLVAAPTDFCVWILAHYLQQQNQNQNQQQQQQQQQQPFLLPLPWICLFCSMISWFHGYSLVRTFSNSIETVLLMISITLVSPELICGNANKKDDTTNINSNSSVSSSQSSSRHCLCFFLGGCSVAMRFSSVTAWIPMGIILAFHHHHQHQQQQQQQQQSSSSSFTFIRIMLSSLSFWNKILQCGIFGIAGIIFATTVDRYFYGFWTIPFLGSFHFNVLLGNSALYGSHPWHWYITSGIPAITGLWFPFVLKDFWLFCCCCCNNKQNNNKTADDDDNATAESSTSTGIQQCGNNNNNTNIWIVVIVYTLAHSISGHKEFRFLLPILPLFCLLAGRHVRSFLLWIVVVLSPRQQRDQQEQQQLKEDDDGNSSAKNADTAKAKATATAHNVRFTDVLPWMILMVIPNLIALLYLGLFHQSAPISVNHKIAALSAAAAAASAPQPQQQSKQQSAATTNTIQSSIIQQQQQQQSTITNTFSIHYLTGACHSTPLHSYLHVASSKAVHFDTWSLDCSPECRSDPNKLCESERFVKDPVGFVQEAYFGGSDSNSNPTISDVEDESYSSSCTTTADEQTCSDEDNKSLKQQQHQQHKPPNYLVTYPDYAMKIQSHLSSLGLQEVGRFSHGINGIRIGSFLETGDGYNYYLGHDDDDVSSHDGGDGTTTSNEDDEDDDKEEERKAIYRRVSFLGGFLEFSIDEMVLFART